MRLLCIGRHPFLSEHLCRFFSDLGSDCEPVVGIANALAVAGTFEPHLVIAEGDLLSPAVLDAWSRENVLAGVPVLAVSLTRRPDESIRADLCGLAGVIYLPTLDRASVIALLDGARRPRGVDAPQDAMIGVSRQPASLH
ncbi:MAG: hypothetical protein JWL61_4947 [Gemmatimonadetes bacterium]|jgi:hypothetical protein|nr:hypothetical protein [Gemmatimonadota bacterium]